VSQDLELLGEIRDLLRIIAEPALAKRDAKLRSSLRTVVGASSKKAKALLLMDGSRSQATIVKEAGIDKGNLSRLVKDLAAAELIFSDQKQPRLLLSLPSDFFDKGGAHEH
jgi:DNA-binding MarR family transcriptional regulator